MKRCRFSYGMVSNLGDACSPPAFAGDLSNLEEFVVQLRMDQVACGPKSLPDLDKSSSFHAARHDVKSDTVRLQCKPSRPGLIPHQSSDEYTIHVLKFIGG